MLVRLATLAFLAPTLMGWHPSNGAPRLVAGSDSAELPIHSGVRQCDKDMAVGRYYVAKRDQVAVVGRFKVFVTKCPTSPDIPEALAHLAEAFVALGVAEQAQNAVAVLERKFPGDQSSIMARNALRSAGLDPAEDEKSWISRALR